MAQKIAFITGGNRGLGFQTALDLGKNKAEDIKVVIGARDKAQGEQALTKLRAAGVDADMIQFDVTKQADYQAAFDHFDSKYGRLDILVNNAGIAGGTFPGEGPEHRAADVPMDLLRKVFRNELLRAGRADRKTLAAH
jgi:NAD(P)-dependent dehydrogenase (short-subunit alcohol dehydrogenase family)